MSEVEESVFQIVQRLVQSIATIAEMMRIGDADQVRHFGLDRDLHSKLIDLAEDINQSRTNADDSEETRDRFATKLGQIILSQGDSLMAAATSIFDRKSNAEQMDTYADKNATAMFITQNQFIYACNHEPTVRAFLDKVNLAVVSRAAGNEREIRVRQLIEALFDGIPRR